MDDAARQLAAALIRQEKKIAALSRGSQMRYSTIPAGGDEIPVPDALTQGVEAGDVASDAQSEAGEARTETTIATGDVDELATRLEDARAQLDEKVDAGREALVQTDARLDEAREDIDDAFGRVGQVETAVSEAAGAAQEAQTKADAASEAALDAITQAGAAASAAGEAQQQADAANQAALEAAGIAAGKGRVIAQPTMPPVEANALWIDTDDGNKAHRAGTLTRHNLASNPKLALDATGWASSSPTVALRRAVTIPDYPEIPNAFGALGATSAATRYVTLGVSGLTPGVTYVARMLVRIEGGTWEQAVWQNALAGTTTRPAVYRQIDTVTGWRVEEISFTATHETAAVGVRCVTTSGSYAWLMTGVTVEDEATSSQIIFDGDFDGATWDGAAGESTSTYVGPGWILTQDAGITEAAQAAADAAQTASDAQTAASNAAADAAAAQGTANQAATDAAAASALAGSAAENASVAITAAGQAQEAAEGAATAAANITRVFHAVTAPAGTAPYGSTWYQHRQIGSSTTNLSGDVIGQWTQTAAGIGSTWTQSAVASELIANLDVGKLTAGSAAIAQVVAEKIAAATAAFQRADVANLFVTEGAVMSEAVIEFLFANIIAAKVISTEYLGIGQMTGNLVPNPSFAGLTGWTVEASAAVSSYAAEVVTDGGVPRLRLAITGLNPGYEPYEAGLTVTSSVVPDPRLTRLVQGSFTSRFSEVTETYGARLSMLGQAIIASTGLPPETPNTGMYTIAERVSYESGADELLRIEETSGPTDLATAPADRHGRVIFSLSLITEDGIGVSAYVSDPEVRAPGEGVYISGGEVLARDVNSLYGRILALYGDYLSVNYAAAQAFEAAVEADIPDAEVSRVAMVTRDSMGRDRAVLEWWRNGSPYVEIGYDEAARILGASTPATDSKVGVVELATQAEVDAGTDPGRVVTPATLAPLASRVGVLEARALPYAEAHGQFVLGTGVAAGEFRDFSVTFPAGRFSVAPAPWFSSDSVRLNVADLPGTVTATGMTVRFFNPTTGGAPAGTVIRWHAAQMTSGSATG